MKIIHIELFLDLGNKGLKLPIHYNHIIQGAIYNSIDNDLANFLHNEGFTVDGRRFKLFTFSRLEGNKTTTHDNNESRIFFGEAKLIISSPIDQFCQSLVNTLLTKGTMLISKQQIQIRKINLNRLKVTNETVIIKTLSPIVLYSTLLRPDGRKYTCYFQPGEHDYQRLITENLRKKYRAIYREEAPLDDIRIKTIGNQKLSIVKYKDFVIKGYSGKLELQGHQKLLQVGLDSGLGSKNSQGFGCVELK